MFSLTQNTNKQEVTFHFLPAAAWKSYLQCTTMAPAYDGLTALTFLRNFSIPMGENGTPKSGQLVK